MSLNLQQLHWLIFRSYILVFHFLVYCSILVSPQLSTYCLLLYISFFTNFYSSLYTNCCSLYLNFLRIFLDVASDITINVSGRSFMLHKVILSSSSFFDLIRTFKIMRIFYEEHMFLLCFHLFFENLLFTCFAKTPY